MDKPRQKMINLPKIKYIATHCILILYGNQNYVTRYLQCEHANTAFVLIKYLAAASDLQDKRQTCTHHQVMKDEEQEIKNDLPPKRHEHKMPSYKIDFLATYKNEYITDIHSHSCYKYTLLNNKAGYLKFENLGFEITELLKVIRVWKHIRVRLNQQHPRSKVIVKAPDILST